MVGFAKPKISYISKPGRACDVVACDANVTRARNFPKGRIKNILHQVGEDRWRRQKNSGAPLSL